MKKIPAFCFALLVAGLCHAQGYQPPGGQHDCWVRPADCNAACMAALEAYHQEAPGRCSNAFPGSAVMEAHCFQDWTINPSYTSLTCGVDGSCSVYGRLKCYTPNGNKFPYYNMPCITSEAHGGAPIVVALETDVSCSYPDGYAITSQCSSTGTLETLITEP